MCIRDRAYMEDASLLPDTSLPLIAVPTTAGTGSEITCVSVLSDHEAGVKKPLSCDAFYPTLAIVDPELTYSVPPHTTACTGMDVLCHAPVSYTHLMIWRNCLKYLEIPPESGSFTCCLKQKCVSVIWRRH